MFSENDKRAVNRGFGDGMARAFEFAVTPMLFGGLGWLIDRGLDTSPVFTIALAVFGIVGMFLRLWYGYDAEMRTHESRWTDRRDRAETAPTADPWTVRKEVRP